MVANVICRQLSKETLAHRGSLEGEVGAKDNIDGELAADVGGSLRAVKLDLPVEEVVAVDLDVDALERLVGEFLEFLAVS